MPVLQEIFAEARAKMVAVGNSKQWVDGYPWDDVIEDDIRRSASYVIEQEGKVVGTFVLIIGEDPTYKAIYEGEWIDDTQTYGTIHRVASRGEVHGVMDVVLAFAFSKIQNIRIDTHEDNVLMRHVIEKAGFQYCGIIKTRNNDDRLAYQKLITREQ